MIHKEMKIEEAIKVKPYITETLEDTGIDFCCGGNRSLKEALEEKNIDVDSFVDLLNRIEKKETKDWTDAIQLKPAELIPYLITYHHRKEEVLIDEIDRNLKKILMVHYENHGKELAKTYQLFLALKAELAPHFAKEEKSVFPLFLEGKNEKARELEDEHEKAGELLKAIEEQTNGFRVPKDGCATYRIAFEKMKELIDDIHVHIFLENSVLFQQMEE